jgi:hypothetical protein
MDTPIYQSVLDTDSLNKCASLIYNFIHACIVGANKGLTNLDTASTVPTTIYQNVFWDSSLKGAAANQALMKTMAKFQFYVFKKMTTVISEQEVYNFANKTRLNLDLKQFGIPELLIFNSQPILPLQADQNQQMYYLTDDTEVPIPLGILTTIFPSFLKDYSLQGKENFNWAFGDNQPSYYASPKILIARALLDFVVDKQTYGYSDGEHSGLPNDDPNGTAFDRDANYVVNLITSSTNFPMNYEMLGMTFQAEVALKP